MCDHCCTIELPASKSITQRLMLIDALLYPEGTSSLLQSIDIDHQCNDIKVLAHALKTYRTTHEVELGESGTAMRLLTAFLATQPGVWRLHGTLQLLSRPMQPLVDALSQLGVTVSLSQVKKGFIDITTNGITGGEVTIDASQSSQFVTALMLIAPMLPNGLKIHLSTKPASMPYIRLTESIMRRCGAEVSVEDHMISIPCRHYTTISHHIETCWSSASYFYELLVAYKVLLKSHNHTIAGPSVAETSSKDVSLCLKHLCLPSLQGDAIVAKMFEPLGIKTEQRNDDVIIYICNTAQNLDDNDMCNAAKGLDTNTYNIAQTSDTELHFDFLHHPDLLPTMVVSCCMLSQPFRFTGIENLVYKESNRVRAIAEALNKCGYLVEVTSHDISCKVSKMSRTTSVEVNCYNDHRIAMSLAPLTLLMPHLVLNDTECVSKSFPSFWQMFARAKAALL